MATDEKWILPAEASFFFSSRRRHTRSKRAGVQTCALPIFRPDAKSQVTVEYTADGAPHRVHTVVLSTQHDESVTLARGGKNYFSDDARRAIIDKLILDRKSVV